MPCASDATYPERPIKVIVPWAAGGDTDSLVRPLMPPLQRSLGVPVMIDNIAGDSGSIGAREAKAALPDGHMLYAVNDTIHLTYLTGVSDVRHADFEAICHVSSTPSLLVASAKAKWSSLKDMIADARARPAQVTVAATLGSTSHVFPALVERAAGVKFTYVAYEGFVQRTSAIVGGHAQLTDGNLTHRAMAEAGQIRLLAIATERRSVALPSVPTLRELGMDVVYAVSRGLMAPKGTPADILSRLEGACAGAIKDPAFADAAARHGAEVRYLDRRAFAASLTSNESLNRDLIKSLGLLKR